MEVFLDSTLQKLSKDRDFCEEKKKYHMEWILIVLFIMNKENFKIIELEKRRKECRYTCLLKYSAIRIFYTMYCRMCH